MKMRQGLLNRILLVFALLGPFFPESSHAQESRQSDDTPRELSQTEIAAAQRMGQSLGIAEWLGPLAPVALSPFFGITCLSGMALYGRGWVSADNAFLSENSPLCNPNVFMTFLVLTLITSIPRFTKVSKPFAQAVDQVEAWAGIITLLALRIILQEKTTPEPEIALVQLGLVSFTVDSLLMLTAAVNIFVVNAVKFFFEMLIWITPIPTLDAIFEVLNKTVCGTLMAVYGFSPTIATAINLTLFAISLIVFRWVYRREVFFRTLLLDAVWNKLRPQKPCSSTELVVFPVTQFGPFAARTQCRLCRRNGSFELTQQRFLRSDVQLLIPEDQVNAEILPGYFCNTLRVSGLTSGDLTFSRCFNGSLSDVARLLNAAIDENSATVRDRSSLKAELC